MMFFVWWLKRGRNFEDGLGYCVTGVDINDKNKIVYSQHPMGTAHARVYRDCTASACRHPRVYTGAGTVDRAAPVHSQSTVLGVRPRGDLWHFWKQLRRKQLLPLFCAVSAVKTAASRQLLQQLRWSGGSQLLIRLLLLRRSISWLYPISVLCPGTRRLLSIEQPKKQAIDMGYEQHMCLKI